MKLARLNQTFVESETTWNEASSGVDWTGGAGAEGNGEFTQPTADITVGGDTQTADITALVVDAIRKRSGTLWLVICFDPDDSATTPTANTGFYPSETATESNRPKIAVTVSERVVWQGGVDGDLSNALNWSTGSVPTSSDYALFTSGSVNATDGSITCSRLYVGRNYKGDIGTSSSSIEVTATEAHFSSVYSGIYVTLNRAESTETKVKINDTSNVEGEFVLNGKYEIVLNRTRNNVTLLTRNVTTVDAHSQQVIFSANNNVTTLRQSRAFSTFDDIPTTVTLASGAFSKISRDNNTNTSITLGGRSSIRCLASTVGSITLYGYCEMYFKDNTGAPIECGAVYVYPNSLLDTRTGAPTWTTTADIQVWNGRVLFDGSRAVTVT